MPSTPFLTLRKLAAGAILAATSMAGLAATAATPASADPVGVSAAAGCFSTLDQITPRTTIKTNNAVTPERMSVTITVRDQQNRVHTFGAGTATVYPRFNKTFTAVASRQVPAGTYRVTSVKVYSHQDGISYTYTPTSNSCVV